MTKTKLTDFLKTLTTLALISFAASYYEEKVRQYQIWKSSKSEYDRRAAAGELQVGEEAPAEMRRLRLMGPTLVVWYVCSFCLLFEMH